MRAEKRAEMRLEAINRAIDMLSYGPENEQFYGELLLAEAERIVDNSACMNCYDMGCPACLGDDEC